MQITIANLSEAQSNERIDSQFFKPEYVCSSNIVSNSEYSILSDISHITDGNHLKISEDFDTEFGVRYLRGQDLNSDMMLSDRNIVYISEESFNNLERSHIFKNDILITIVGANTGLVGLIFNPPEKLVANCKLGIVRPDNREISSGFLYAFLIGRFGQHQILRSIRGGGQTGLILPDMRQLKITRLSNEFEKNLDSLVFKGHSGYELSKGVYHEAQNLLLAELGLIDWQSKHQLTFIKNFSDTQEAERIDAEYFQPKYDEIINAIKSYKGGYSTVREEFRQNKSTFEIVDEKPYQYVEIGSINVSNGEISPSDVLGADLPANAKRVLNKNDIIVSKVRTYRGAITIVDKDGYVGSGAFTALTENGSVNKETLLAFLHSKPLLAWSLKPNTGTSYPVIVDDDILNLPIPLLSQAKQQEIHQKVTESFELRRQSKQLLENAKYAVEMAIEKDEKQALAWLEANTTN